MKRIVARPTKAPKENIINFEMSMDEFKKAFGIDIADGDEMFFSDGVETSDNEIRDAAEQFDIPEELLENGEIYSGIATALQDGVEHGTQKAYWKAVVHLVEEVLETFSDYRYEHFSEADFKGNAGVAKGIITKSIKVDWDKVSFQAYDDLAFIVQDCIAGYGMFDVDSEFEGETKADYAKSRLHWLEHYWEIYGSRKPHLDDINYDFDRESFKTYMNDVVMPMVQEIQASNPVVETDSADGIEA